ncbi:M48 family metallopeptidase [Brevundimonas sp.]|uniref:M48 family metallopeptidase n=1 Tax=Brevundimonas sp. TaxID=1871086 RepID=UPI001A2BEBA7|nr:M48 family metallopeptidase [Brevundimonas sp.]MBJ7485464.1 M48 family metallopeptidase [Brevundimonas sp.]
MGAVGLKTHIWANNTRSIVLLAGFPVLLVLILYGLQLILMGFGFLPNSGESLGADMGMAASMLAGTIPLALVVAGVWFAIAWFGNQAMIDAMTGARKVTRQDQPELYNLLENLCISRGIKTPTLRIIETDTMNAYASGLSEGHYSVTVTSGLMQALDRDEIEAVLAHELTHILNKDVRTMVIASIFAGIISVIAQLIFRGLFYVRGGGRKNKNAGALIAVGLIIAAIGFALSIVIRLMLSRTREFVADAGSVELTKNPDAMISALRKISGRSYVRAPDDVQGMFLDNEPEKGNLVDEMFATHPPIEKRIAALVEYAGGRDQGPWDPDALEAGVSVTAVPTTTYGTAVPTS